MYPINPAILGCRLISAQRKPTLKAVLMPSGKSVSDFPCGIFFLLINASHRSCCLNHSLSAPTRALQARYDLGIHSACQDRNCVIPGATAAIATTATVFAFAGAVVSLQRQSMTYVYGGQRGQCVRAELESHGISIRTAAFTGIYDRSLVVRGWYECEFPVDPRPLDKVRWDDDFDAGDKFALVHAPNKRGDSGIKTEDSPGIVTGHGTCRMASAGSRTLEHTLDLLVTLDRNLAESLRQHCPPSVRHRISRGIDLWDCLVDTGS